MKLKTTKEVRQEAEIRELRAEIQRLLAQIAKLKPDESTPDWPECPWCGNARKAGHDCRPEK